MSSSFGLSQQEVFPTSSNGGDDASDEANDAVGPLVSTSARGNRSSRNDGRLQNASARGCGIGSYDEDEDESEDADDHNGRPSRHNTHFHGLSHGTPSRRPRTVRTRHGSVFEVWPMPLEIRRVNDEVHTSIIIHQATKVVLDTPQVQRLRNLVQLGCAPFAFPSCSHTRLEHCLGVMEAAGTLAESLMSKQPRLGITKKDVLCVRLAGLCHDLGHGPFSHVWEVFLGMAKKREEEMPEVYQRMNEEYEREFGMALPRLDVFEHEEASLMMIDDLLAHLGLAIDFDKLDSPLKQIGPGQDAAQFGVHDDDSIDTFTSRDWIFIKECIYGEPLPPGHRCSRQRGSNNGNAVLYFEGRGREKEFLFDIVNNRHSGMDVDKMDYFARDGRRARGSAEMDVKILQDSCVAWGECPNPKKCFCCSHKTFPEKHLMISYPMKLVSKIMDFFKTRMRNHREIYTHKKTKRAELLLVDIMLEADLHSTTWMSTQLNDPGAPPTIERFRSFQYPKLPISRAFLNPNTYLRLDDRILAVIENYAIETEGMEKLRNLINRYRKHDFYKCAGALEVDAVNEDDAVWNLSENEITQQLVVRGEYEHGLKLRSNDVIVEKREIHHGLKKENPVSRCRFLSKWQCSLLGKPTNLLPEAMEADEADYASDIPRSFVRRTVRVYSRSKSKDELLCHAFEQWKEYLKGTKGCNIEKMFEEDANTEEAEDTKPATLLTQDSDSGVSPAPVDCAGTFTAIRKRKHINGDGASPKKRPVKLFDKL